MKDNDDYRTLNITMMSIIGAILIGLFIALLFSDDQQAGDEWVNEQIRKQIEWLSSPEYELARKQLYDSFRKVDSIVFILNNMELYEPNEEAK